MATMTPISRVGCSENGCRRDATQVVMKGDNGPLVGSFCGAHAMKALRATAKAEGASTSRTAAIDMEEVGK